MREAKTGFLNSAKTGHDCWEVQGSGDFICSLLFEVGMVKGGVCKNSFVVSGGGATGVTFSYA